jgi:hypothetical protein
MRIKIVLLLFVLWMAACNPEQKTPGEPGTVPPDTAVTSPPEQEIPSQEPMKNPYAHQPHDSNLTRGEVFIQEKGLLVRESYPPQISLSVSGGLPTPCNELRVQVGEPDETNNIKVDAYSVVDPNMMCIQVLKPFQASIDLGTFPSGHYSVYVNGELAGEFDS